MLILGSDDGAYRVADADGQGTGCADERGDGSGDGSDGDALDVEKVLDAGRVMRVRTFESVDGAFAASRTGLYHSDDGSTWTDLGVPREEVYAVGASPGGDRLYAGTRPAAVFVAEVGSGALESADGAPSGGQSSGEGSADLDWRELDGFQELPSRDEWRLPRHENLAQVRDVHAPAPDRLVAGVEVGGVHVSDDGGGTWSERRQGSHDDVHELQAATADEWVAATGNGLYVTADAGQTWRRLDEAVPQTYFRSVVRAGGVAYASGALANSSTWDDPDADPEVFAWDGGSLDAVDLPTDDEMVTGLATVGDTVAAGTHRGTLLVRRSDCWLTAGTFPVRGQLTGRYTPLAWFEPG